jgi:hypothetical protein
VRFVHFPRPDLAVMHAVCGVVLSGGMRRAPSRESMQLFVLSKKGGAWLVDAVMNARRLALEQQAKYDDIES